MTGTLTPTPVSPPAPTTRTPSRPVTPPTRPARSAAPARCAPPAAAREPPPSGGKVKLGYFAEWGVYGRNYHVKNIDTSGSAAQADPHQLRVRQRHQRPVRDRRRLRRLRQGLHRGRERRRRRRHLGRGALRGSFNQLRKLKRQYPNIKVLWSFGGWTWSGGFGQAAAEPDRVRQLLLQPGRGPALGRRVRRHRHRLGVPERLRPVLRHQRPGSPSSNLMQALRTRFGTELPGHRGDHGRRQQRRQDRRRRLRAAPRSTSTGTTSMTYDFFGAFAAQGPTAPHSPLTSLRRHPAGRASTPTPRSRSSRARASRPASCCSASASTAAAGPASPRPRPAARATGAAPGTYEAGIEDYKVLKNTLPGHRHRRAAPRTPTAAATGGATTPRPPSPAR